MKRLIIDVREPDEYAQSHVEGAINIPMADLEASVESIKSSAAGGQVVLYCRSGGRAGRARAFLERQGVPNVINGINQATIERQLHLDA